MPALQDWRDSDPPPSRIKLKARRIASGDLRDADDSADSDTAEENAALLRSGAVSPQFAEPPRRELRNGWIVFRGFKLPWPLVILFALPPTIVILSFIGPLKRHKASRIQPLPILSNGTHEFHPTTVLVSLDGFRPDYLTTHADLLPHLTALSAGDGISAKSMQPIFPTLTFPNHWSLATGMYAESHGIVANDFWAPDIGSGFSSGRPEDSWDGKWWGGEPMWSVAERGGRRAVNYMWPGPPTTAAGISPSFFVSFQNTRPTEKVPDILHYFDMGLEAAPTLIMAYIPDVDEAGHKGGPESKAVNEALQRVDGFIGDIRAAIEARNLGHIVDLIIISDHGMKETSKDRLVFYDDVLGADLFSDLEHRDGWPSLGLRFKQGIDTSPHLAKLRASAAASNGTWSVYTKEDMPERWHFSHGRRVAPIYLVPNLGWVITDHREYEHYGGGDLMVKGCHGFDNTFPEMQAIFLAHGPFAERAKAKAQQNSAAPGWVTTSPPVLEPFRNLEIFDLVMRLQRLENIAPPHNGSLTFWDTYL